MRYQHQPSRSGFARIDLVMILGMVALLGGVALSNPAFSQMTEATTVCMENLRTMTRAWTQYAQDNDGRLVAAGNYPDGTPPEWSGGQWLDLPESKLESLDPLEPNNGLVTSPLWSYTGEDPSVYRCPLDASTGSNPAYQDGAQVPRVRSYSMQNRAGGPEWSSSGHGWKVYEQMSDFTVPGPAESLVFLDEKAQSINDGYFPIDMIGFDPYGPGNRFARVVNYPASRHSGSAVVTFADGHVDQHGWVDSRTNPDVSPGEELALDIQSPSNPDVHWLQLHATRRSDEPIPPKLTYSGLANGEYEGSIHGADARDYQIEASSDLENWQIIQNVSRLNGEIPFTDDEAANHERRIYRVKSGQ